MVALADLNRAAALGGEKNNINAALTNLQGGGRIVSMTIAPPEDNQDTVSSATVSTFGMEYPQAMTDAITQGLQARRAQIEQQLGELGVTDINAEPRR